MHRRMAVLAASVALACTATACGSGGDDDGKAAAGGIAGPGSGTGKTITVWYMDGDLSDAAVKAIGDRFTKDTGAQVKVQIQEWDGINTKITTALAQHDPPDVIELGNTAVPLFAAAGGLADITAHGKELSRGQTWLPGLAGPATIDGKLYGAPLFAGERAVVYNKKIWAKAGITAPPATLAEFTADLDKIGKSEKGADFSPFYMPGQYWFGGVQFVWDAGGQIAEKKDGKWAGALSSPQAQKGLADWKRFQNTYSTPASRNLFNLAPDYNAILAQGKTSAILNTSVNAVLKIDPKLKDDLGTFPFPGASGNQPVFLGGSDLAVPAKSANRALALAYLKAATDPQVQTSAIVGLDGWTPISTELIDRTAATRTPLLKAFSDAAKRSVATPASPGWATIESDKSLQSFFGDISTGKTPIDAAAKAFDAHLTQALNAAP
ncbi:extracellular solute-binding protein [Actinomadura parmotrematis]|uniref:Extracellular solute-binding protein n=1 Tax=Actinomadura parmotrematis TaxID=2864039 RepID=A0ABS7FLU3_9ACTN|nr:extracellular solute-binding protein [Actinomadura parmotrematis]MBW8481319.1 extracellular solute-binding protein [Actinomadura parmotrematis]